MTVPANSLVLSHPVIYYSLFRLLLQIVDPVIGEMKIPEVSVTGLVIRCHLCAMLMISCKHLLRGIQVNTLIRSQMKMIRGGKKSTLKRLVSVANQQLLNFKTPHRLFKKPNAVL